MTDDAPHDTSPSERVSDADFKRLLSDVIPHLRAFGRSLTGNRDLTDDLVQETMLKAWHARDRFQAGTSMRAWTFVILRNLFLSQMRRNRFHGNWDDLVAERVLSAPAAQDKQLDLADLQRAMQMLPQAQREALVLVGAGGLSYEEAAAICDVAVGTIKSRVARARTALEQLMTEGQLPPRAQADAAGQSGAAAMADIMSSVETLTGPQPS